MDYSFLEPFLEERIESAKALARRLADGIIETVDEFELSICIFLSHHYGIPLFDKYFEDRTLDDLIFEAEVIKLQTDGGPRGSNMLKDKPEEAAGMFDDWIEEDAKDSAAMAQNEAFLQDAQKFMETGDFIGETDQEEQE